MELPLSAYIYVDNIPEMEIDLNLRFIILQNIIASTDADHIPEVLFNLILHEISHALGFSQSQFKK